MESVALLIAVVALALVGACVWLVRQRGICAGDLVSARTDLARAEAQRDEQARERAAAEAEVSRLSGEAKDLGGRLGEVREELARLNAELAGVRAMHEQEIGSLCEEHAAGAAAATALHAEKLESVEREKKSIAEKLAEFDKKMQDAFGAMAAKTLERSTEELLKLAEQRLGVQSKAAEGELEKRRAAIEAMVKPMQELLGRTDQKLAELEKERVTAYTGLRTLVEQGTRANAELAAETRKLGDSLRKPQVRGRYGELQLRRVAELAGMTSYCGFTEQSQTRDLDGNALRPDMIVNLPNERIIVVDAKTNIEAYLDAVNAPDAAAADGHLERFARHVAEQAMALAKKKYWSQYDGSPEFVVMFIPGDQFIDAALSRQSGLLERAAEQGVLLASPSTLIGLLRAVAVGFQEQRLAKTAEELRGLGKELHERAAVAMGHASKLGRSLTLAVESFNDFVGSYERRLEPVLRKFEESGARSAKELPAIVAVQASTRLLDGAALNGL